MNCNNLKQNKRFSQKEQAALIYASKLEWLVLPLHSILDGKCTCSNVSCSSPGKHPRTQNGVKDASKDLRIITDWWQKWPDANIGIATGRESRFFVLDVDGQDGADSLYQLVSIHGRLPDTVESLTGSGGRHILFQYPADMVVGNKVALSPGLDIRGHNGYIVAPPSNHISGKQYNWEASSRPVEVATAVAPEWLLKILYQPQDLKRTVEDWRQLVNQGVAEGKRNTSIASLAGHLFRNYIDPWIVLDMLLSWNKSKCRPPLDDGEVALIVDSVAKLEARRREGCTNGIKGD